MVDWEDIAELSAEEVSDSMSEMDSDVVFATVALAGAEKDSIWEAVGEGDKVTEAVGEGPDGDGDDVSDVVLVKDPESV